MTTSDQMGPDAPPTFVLTETPNLFGDMPRAAAWATTPLLSLEVWLWERASRLKPRPGPMPSTDSHIRRVSLCPIDADPSESLADTVVGVLGRDGGGIDTEAEYVKRALHRWWRDGQEDSFLLRSLAALIGSAVAADHFVANASKPEMKGTEELNTVPDRPLIEFWTTVGGADFNLWQAPRELVMTLADSAGCIPYGVEVHQLEAQVNACTGMFGNQPAPGRRQFAGLLDLEMSSVLTAANTADTRFTSVTVEFVNWMLFTYHNS